MIKRCLCIITILTITGFVQCEYKPCQQVKTADFEVNQLNGTWYVYAYTVPRNEMDTMCDAFHINVNGSGTFVNYTYVDRPTGIQKQYLATITKSKQPGSFLYSIDNEPSDTATIVYVLLLDGCNFVNYGCETHYDHFGSLVIATKNRELLEVNLEQLISKGIAAGAPSESIRIINQKNCND